MDDEAEPPPGRPLHELTAEQQRLALVALDGLVAQLRAKRTGLHAGSTGSRDLAELIGQAVTAADALRRHLAAHDQA